MTEPVEDLNRMPGMVRWFAPKLLIWAAFHDSVSRLFGRYADQRVIQHLSDPIPHETADDARRKFVHRYDYSESPGRADGEFWVDYVADMGDGFDSTYAIAHLLAAEKLEGGIGLSEAAGIKRIPDLPAKCTLQHGRLLLLGGDAIYPWPSQEEYESHLMKPYSWALPKSGEQARTDVFAIPGNHDWYDGLAAFDDLFCRARSDASRRNPTRFGDWQTRQHRSYFAIKLPNNWWIWGADIQLNRQIDNGQREYFRAVSEFMQKGDNFILCTAQPSWYYLDKPEERYERQNLRTLIDAPIRRGAKLCAILSGDWHHYCRYQETDQLNINLITAGGGGAYLAGTSQLESAVKFEWLGRDLEFRMDRKLQPSPTAAENGEPQPTPTAEDACYPSRRESKRLAWGNLKFPFRNWTFALAIGVVYWLLAWSFSGLKVGFWVNIPPSVSVQQIESTFDVYEAKKLKFDMPSSSPSSEGQIIAHWLLKEGDVACSTASGRTHPLGAAPSAQGPASTIRCVGSLPILNWTLFVIDVGKETWRSPANSEINVVRKAWSVVALLFSNGVQLLLLGIVSSPFAMAFLLAVWFTLFSFAESNRSGRPALITRLIIGSLHFSAHLIALWALFCILWAFNKNYVEDWLTDLILRRGKFDTLLGAPVEFWINFFYTVEMVGLGMLLGGLIFGIYLIACYRLGKLHPDLTFSAMQIADYKCFLRLRFEKNRLTIYPIRLKRVPVRNRPNIPGFASVWRWARNPQPSLVEPSRPLDPRLIEGPVVIDTTLVQNIPRT